MLNFLWLALGISALLIAIFLAFVLFQLGRTLESLQQTLATVDATLQEIGPEIRSGLSNVNNITAGVNSALRAAGDGASRAGSVLETQAEAAIQRVQAAGHGFKMGLRSVWSRVKGENPIK